jgi:hypothetical protein
MVENRSTAGRGSPRLVRETVTDSPGGEYVLRLSLVRFDLHSDAPHGNVNTVAINVDIVLPHRLDDRVPVEHNAPMEHEKFQDFELPLGHQNLPLVNQYSADFTMQFQAASGESRCAFDDVELDFAFCADVIASRQQFYFPFSTRRAKRNWLGFHPS